MKNFYIILFIITIPFACKKEYDAAVPNTSGWDIFNSLETKPLSYTTQSSMEGVYTLTGGAETFGNLTTIKLSYVIEKKDTTFNISGFFGKDIAYFICTGKKYKNTILLNGYWRKMVSAATGIIHLTIAENKGAQLLFSANPIINNGDVIVEGSFGYGQSNPTTPISFTYTRKLFNSKNFGIMAHRSGGRTSDLLPVSENSVAMIKKTAAFGSTGIEIDVRMTSDGVPVLYHDNTLNIREVQKSGLVGPINNYTFDQLSTFVRLIHGEKIPTLREALNVVVYQTPLNFVWLDTKYTDSMILIRNIQREYLKLAADAGRNLQIVIGLPTTEAYNLFKTLPNYKDVPSLLELSVDDVPNINAKVWAPRFTLGPQNDLVDRIHTEGRLAFVWTLDVPEYIEKFIKNGHFDAILSNYPSCVAYNYYVQQ